MSLVFQRWLAIPTWALAFVAVGLTAPLPATLSLIAAAAIAVATRKLGPRVRTPDEPTGTSADDAVDLGRMDDDGGSQMARPLA
jgi:hypothetical protein